MYHFRKIISTALLALTCCGAMQAGGGIQFRFNADGKFKIMQVTDTHIVASSEHSKVTTEMLNQVLDAEKPDLVIFTGDVVTGKPYKAGFDMVIQPLLDRNIPWALVFGNHDEEQDLKRPELANFIQNYRNNAGNMKKVKKVSGYGNFTIEVKDRAGKQVKAVLYGIDSHDYSTLKPRVDGYGWINFDQVRWYQATSDKYTKANGGQPVPSLAFFHIPLMEYRLVYQEKGHKMIGTQNEKVCSPEINTGLCAAMIEKGDIMGCFVGHDHINDYIFNYFGIALAYGRWSGSKNTYGDWKNGVRLIELTEGVKGFDSWVRLNSEIVIDRMKFPDDLSLPQKK